MAFVDLSSEAGAAAGDMIPELFASSPAPSPLRREGEPGGTTPLAACGEGLGVRLVLSLWVDFARTLNRKDTITDRSPLCGTIEALSVAPYEQSLGN